MRKERKNERKMPHSTTKHEHKNLEVDYSLSFATKLNEVYIQ